MGYNYRCGRSTCRQRVTLKRRINEYVKSVSCKACGGTLHHDPSVRARSKALVCHCDGYHFPHRKGSYYCKDYAGTKDDAYEHERAYRDYPFRETEEQAPDITCL